MRYSQAPLEKVMGRAPTKMKGRVQNCAKRGRESERGKGEQMTPSRNNEKEENERAGCTIRPRRDANTNPARYVVYNLKEREWRGQRRHMTYSKWCKSRTEPLTIPEPKYKRTWLKFRNTLGLTKNIKPQPVIGCSSYLQFQSSDDNEVMESLNDARWIGIAFLKDYVLQSLTLLSPLK